MLRLWSLFLQPLDQICLRLAFEALGRHALGTGMNGAPKKVFISSTYADLVGRRRAVLEQIVRRDLSFSRHGILRRVPLEPATG